MSKARSTFMFNGYHNPSLMFASYQKKTKKKKEKKKKRKQGPHIGRFSFNLVIETSSNLPSLYNLHPWMPIHLKRSGAQKRGRMELGRPFPMELRDSLGVTGHNGGVFQRVRAGHDVPSSRRWIRQAANFSGCFLQSYSGNARVTCKCKQDSPTLAESSSSPEASPRKKKVNDDSVLLVEKIGNEVTRKYSIGAVSIEEKLESSPYSVQVLEKSSVQAGWRFLPVSVPQMFGDFFLPTDFPDSVTHDYLVYMLWQLPTNITGWICSTLVTSSLLKAVGVDAWAGSTVAATAAIKWVSRDGLGAFGRLFIGGQFGRVFDDDPKQWRMYAELIGSFGSIFELATPIFPDLFLPLASLGQLTKAVGRGLRDPSFRVIQTHFAVAENMGEVSAKEEVWGVAGELVGIAFGVALLATPGLAASYSTLIITWASIRALHLWFRYQSLSRLQFSTINYKRAFILARSHVLGLPIPGICECSKTENLLLPWQFSNSYLQLGCSLKEAVIGKYSMEELEELLGMYVNEEYVLTLNQNAMHRVNMQVVFKEGATSTTVLRCIWQTEWLKASTTSDSQIQLGSVLSSQESCTPSSELSMLSESLRVLSVQFDDFIHKIEQAGWETSKSALKLPKRAPFLSAHYSAESKHV